MIDDSNKKQRLDTGALTSPRLEKSEKSSMCGFSVLISKSRRKSMPNFAAVTIAAQLVLSSLAVICPAIAGQKGGGSSLCLENEQVLFSCKMKASSKFLSVCSSNSLEGTNQYLQYRFGRPDKIELEFPSVRARSIEQFRLTHYFRAQVDRRDLFFKNGNVSYSVFSHFEGEGKKPQSKSGVVVQTNSSAKKTFLYCSEPYNDHLEELDDVVTCDPDAPIGSGGCP